MSLPFVLLEYSVDTTPKYVHRLLPRQEDFEAHLSVPVEDLTITLDRIKLTRGTVGTIYISNDYSFPKPNEIHFESLEGIVLNNAPIPLLSGLSDEKIEQIDFLLRYYYYEPNPADPSDTSYGIDKARDLADKFNVYGYEVDWDKIIKTPAIGEAEELKLKTGSFVAKLLEEFPCPDPETYGFDIDHKTWTQLIYARKKKKNVMLVGPTGTGKTEMAQIVTNVIGEELFIQDMGTIQDAQSTLQGVHRIDEHGHSKFDPAPFIEYLKSGQSLLLDELNRGPLSVQNMTFPMLDRRRYMPLDLAGSHEERKVKLHDETWVVATANVGAEYGATNSIDRAFKDRFQIIECGYMSTDREIKILMLRTGIDEKQARSIVDIATQTREMAYRSELSEAISTRHTLATAEQVVDGIDLIDALNAVVLTLFEDDSSASEREKVRGLFAGF